jgi:tetratricopeptide (TPR) repeat protein
MANYVDIAMIHVSQFRQKLALEAIGEAMKMCLVDEFERSVTFRDSLRFNSLIIFMIDNAWVLQRFANQDGYSSIEKSNNSKYNALVLDMDKRQLHAYEYFSHYQVNNLDVYQDIDKAFTFYMEDKYSEAEKLLNPILISHKIPYWATMLKALILNKKGEQLIKKKNYKNALKLYIESSRLCQNSYSLLKVAELYEKVGNLKEARATCQQIIETWSDNVPAARILERLNYRIKEINQLRNKISTLAQEEVLKPLEDTFHKKRNTFKIMKLQTILRQATPDIDEKIETGKRIPIVFKAFNAVTLTGLRNRNFGILKKSTFDTK